MRVADRLLPVATAQIGVDRLTLDRPWPDQGHLHRQVVEGARFHSREGCHLGPRLDLEQPDGVGPGHHPVYRRLLRDGGKVEGHPVHVLDGVGGEMQCVEHPEPEQIELDDANGGAVVLVPLQDRASLHTSPLQRHHLPQGAVGDDHPP